MFFAAFNRGSFSSCFKRGVVVSGAALLMSAPFIEPALAAVQNPAVQHVPVPHVPVRHGPVHHGAAQHTVKKEETDFECAVHTAYGEARNTSRAEEAVVINILVERAHDGNMSICSAAHKFFKPRKGSTDGINAAAENVLHGDKSMVPVKFSHVTEMRAFHAPAPPLSKYRLVGSVDEKPKNGLHGNIFYEPITVRVTSRH